MERPIALITGATSGIGLATSIMFASLGYDMIITGRRLERLKDLKSDIENKYNVRVQHLCFDIRCKEEKINSFSNLRQEWRNIDVLINNAGLASGLEPIQDGDFED